MDINAFVEKFGNEEQCRLDWKTKRESKGISCQRCGSIKMLWKKKRWEWRCMDCQTCLTLRSGTMMEHSNLKFKYWYKVMYFMTSTKKGISALEMQRQLGFKRYEPVWYMMHKVRISMGNRDEKYQLEGLVEVDDAFVKVIKDDGSNRPKKGQGIRGRGSETTSTIVVMTSAEKVSNPRKKRPSLFPKYVKIYQADNLKGETIQEKLGPSIKSTSQIVTDGYQGYSKLGKMFRKHNQMTIPSAKAHILLPCVHTTIGNLKRYINGVLHHVNDSYLQNYLDEFCYKVNRRWFPSIFERLTLAAIDNDWGENG